MSSHDIFSLRKKGHSSEALAMARAEYSTAPKDIWLLRAYGWALFDHIKAIVERYDQKQLSPAALSQQLSPYMYEFSRMAESLRGDNTFSQVLRLAGKASRAWPDFLAFARWAGTADFGEDGKKPFVNDEGKTVDSLQKSFVRAICRATADNISEPSARADLITWGTEVLEEALRSDPQDQWLNLYQCKIHLARGEREAAIARLLPVLGRQSRTAWAWAQLGEILDETRPHDALTCFAHATEVAREEQEVARVRILLAERLANASRYSEAAQQAMLALQYRESHGFKIPPELQRLLASEWYGRSTATREHHRLARAETAARDLFDQLSRQNLTYTRGVIDHINTEKALSFVATGTETGVGLMHRKFPDVVDVAPGTVVEVGRATPDGPPLAWRLCEARTLPGLCESITGTLERAPAKAFAFLRCARGDVFVPPGLAEGFAEGQTPQVTCLAIWRNNKQGKAGWRAVKIL